MKTADLTGAALDWAVATVNPQCEGLTFKMIDGVICGTDPEDGAICIYMMDGNFINRLKQRNKAGFNEAIAFNPSTDWAQGGPIIEREDISFRKYHRPDSAMHGTYYAKVCRESGSLISWSKLRDSTGTTPLIAAMRCYVASKLGDDVEIPEELT